MKVTAELCFEQYNDSISANASMLKQMLATMSNFGSNKASIELVVNEELIEGADEHFHHWLCNGATVCSPDDIDRMSSTYTKFSMLNDETKIVVMWLLSDGGKDEINRINEIFRNAENYIVVEDKEDYVRDIIDNSDLEWVVNRECDQLGVDLFDYIDIDYGGIASDMNFYEFDAPYDTYYIKEA